MHKNRQLNILQLMPNNTINPDVQKRRFALLLHAGYGERYVPLILGDLNDIS